jgi:FxsC-like protein
LEVWVLYFFLSYARGGDDVYVQEFFNDLCDEIRVLEGLSSSDEVGFFDKGNIQPGHAWSQTLVEALSQCQSFLALCSPAYFLSEPCGKEWAIFQERSRRFQERTGHNRSALIPLRWLPSRTMPEAAQVLQYVQEPSRGNSLSEPYRERGLRQLLRIQRNRDDYLEFVTTVAERVVDTVLRAQLPAATERVEFEGVPSAFHRPSNLVRSQPWAVEPTALLPLSDKVYFVVSAPTAEEAAESNLGRTDLQFYGETASEWSPFRPVSMESLLNRATRVAANRGLAAHAATLDELDACLASAQRDNQIVVLLVDPWSALIDRHRDILHRYDQRLDQPAAVMIPWNRHDEETMTRSSDLAGAISRTFPYSVRRPISTTFRQRIPTLEAFTAELAVALEESRNRILSSSAVRRPLPRLATAPILDIQ